MSMALASSMPFGETTLLTSPRIAWGFGGEPAHFGDAIIGVNINAQIKI
jgi:hypothetical protein